MHSKTSLDSLPLSGGYVFGMPMEEVVKFWERSGLYSGYKKSFISKVPF